MASFTFDASYCDRLREGDVETSRHFVGYFGPLLLAKLRRRVRSSALIDEIRQETFLRAFRALQSDRGLQEPGRLGAFVHGICQNTMREYLRTDSRTELMAEDADAHAGDSPTPENELISAEAKQMVRSTVARLTERDQQLLRAVFFEERDKEEICREIGVDRGYLRVLLHRAKANFRALFTAEVHSHDS